MTDTPTDDTPPQTLRDSKLYALARAEPLMGFLQPTIDLQMAIEEQLTEDFPRVDDDGDDTRILMIFTDRKNKIIVSKLMDHERLDNEFKLTEFMGGFVNALGAESLPGTEVDKVNSAIATTLNVALGTVLGVDNDRTMSKSQQELSKRVVRSIVSVLYDDPLDAVLIIKEQLADPSEGEPPRYVSILTGIWRLTTRPVPALAE